MISEEDIKSIAALARLSLSAEEIIKFQKEFTSFLNQAGRLQEIMVEGVVPFSFSEPRNVVRADALQKGEEDAKDLISKTKEGYLKVKSVF